MIPASLTVAQIAIIGVAVIGWLAFAFITGTLGRNNGQSYGLWLTIGLVTGPLGLAFAYVYFRVVGERRVRTRYGDRYGADVLPTMIRCPGCGETIPARYDTCQFCGCRIVAHRTRKTRR